MVGGAGDQGEGDHPGVAPGELLGPERDPAQVLQPPDHALADVAPTVLLTVEGRPPPGAARPLRALVVALRDDRADAAGATPGADRARRVPLVAGDGGRPAPRRAAVPRDGDPLHQRDELRALVDLARGDAEADHHARAVADDVELTAPPTPRTPQGVVGGLAPADRPARAPGFSPALPPWP